jgi:membrane-associated phospholipid phosphatase
MVSKFWAATRAAPTLVVLMLGTAVPAQAQDPPRCDQHGFLTIFTCIPNDLREIARKDSLTWLGIGGALAAGSLFVDDEVTTAVTDPESHAWFKPGDPLGEAATHFVAPLALYAIAKAGNHEGAASLGVTLLRVQVVNGILTRSLKFLPRARPYQEEADFGKGSFPSGHTSAAFATATVLHRRFGWRGGIPAYGVATYIGISRLERVHYLSDVMFGAGLGIASGLTVKVPGASQTALSPIIAPGVRGFVFAVRYQ